MRGFESVEFEFVVTDEDMERFALLSGDRSAIHTDDRFAKMSGFRERIVYGGILLAKLSGCLGGHLPGNLGVSLGWKIDYRAPLYIGEVAVFQAEPKSFSASVRVLEISFTIRRGGIKIATGSAQSRILSDQSDGALETGIDR